MDELGNILEKYLECTVYKTRKEKEEKINFNKFMGGELKKIIFFSKVSQVLKLKKMEENKFL